MRIKERIWSLFGIDYNQRDSYKDTNDRGFLQRYNEMLAEDMDTHILPKVEQLIDRLLMPHRMDNKFIGHLEGSRGVNVVIDFSDNELRKVVLQIIIQVNRIKGTKLSYEVMLRLLGFDTVEVIEDFTIYSFDSPVTLDDEVRRLDSGGRCAPCTDYDINLTGAVPMTATLLSQIKTVIDYVEPINAKLRKIYYEGFDITDGGVVFFILDFELGGGDLSYILLGPADIAFSIVDGDLIATGSLAPDFSITDADIFQNI